MSVVQTQFRFYTSRRALQFRRLSLNNRPTPVNRARFFSSVFRHSSPTPDYQLFSGVVTDRCWIIVKKNYIYIYISIERFTK